MPTQSHLPPYLSPSRLSCYEWCPAEYRKRYVLKHDEPPTVERLFGTAVHTGLEALYRGQDEEIAFMRAWRTAKAELVAAGQPCGSGLSERGLVLLEQVRNLKLAGEPERKIGVIAPDVHVPFLGYVDLWSYNHIYDFKTTGYAWTQKKSDAQIFQPAIYSQAYSDEHMVIPRFTFVILSRIMGPAQMIDGTRTGDQIIGAFSRAREILMLIESQVFDCKCGKHDSK